VSSRNVAIAESLWQGANAGDQLGIFAERRHWEYRELACRRREFRLRKCHLTASVVVNSLHAFFVSHETLPQIGACAALVDVDIPYLQDTGVVAVSLR
jgi:hypothetical protein